MQTDPAIPDDHVSERSSRLAACLIRARAGDLSALDEVVVELNPLLWQVARAQDLSQEDAADVVQTTWLELIRHLHAIRSPMALTSWLVSATKREAWRMRSRRRKTVGMAPEVWDTAVGHAPAPEERLAAAERQQTLWRHFTQLTPRCRTLLRVVAQVRRPDYAVIAEALGMPHGSIGPTRGRCLAKLRAMLLADPKWSAE